MDADTYLQKAEDEFENLRKIHNLYKCSLTMNTVLQVLVNLTYYLLMFCVKLNNKLKSDKYR